MTLLFQAILAVTFHRRRAVLTSLSRSREQAHRWVKDKYKDQLQVASGNLFGDKFIKQIQKDARSVELTSLQYQQCLKKPQHFQQGSTARPRTGSSAVEPWRATATATSRGSRGKKLEIKSKNELSAPNQSMLATNISNKCTPSNKRVNKTNKYEVSDGGRLKFFLPQWQKNHIR